MCNEAREEKVQNGELTTSQFSELSRHYDTTHWVVTSLWSAAIGGLLLYTNEKFDVGFAVLGLGMTVCAMFFSASFRHVRRRVHDRMNQRDRELHTSAPAFRQWNVIAVLFVVLAAYWIRLLIIHRVEFLWVWLLLGLTAVVIILCLWKFPKDNA